LPCEFAENDMVFTEPRLRSGDAMAPSRKGACMVDAAAPDAPPAARPVRFGLDAVNSAVQTLAILGAGAWGIYTFVYEAKIKPGLAPPTVSVTSTLEKAGMKDGLVAIRSTVTRTNVGQTGVRLLGLAYNVVGVRIRFGGEGAGAEMAAREADLARSASVHSAARYAETGDGEVILRQGTLFEGATALPTCPSHLNPGEAVSRDLVFYVDPSRFNSVRFQVSLSYNKLAAPPVPLAFAVVGGGRLAVVPDAACAAAAGCGSSATTDFATELSLW